MVAPVRYRKLTDALDDAAGAPRAVIDSLISDGRGVRELQRAYNADAGPLLVGSRGGNPGTIGTAFDVGVRFLVDPAPNLAFAAGVAAVMGEEVGRAVAALADIVGARVVRTARGMMTEPLLAPLAVPDRDMEQVARAAWAFALFEEVYRSGGVYPGSPLDPLLGRPSTFTPDDLLDLAPSGVVWELRELLGVAVARLIPAIAAEPSPWYVGPGFPLSAVLPADADLIAGSILVELKTKLGDRLTSGVRATRVDRETLRQILGYVLQDADDDYGLTRVGLYSARYGYFASWPIADLLALTCGRPVDLREERARWRTAIRAS